MTDNIFIKTMNDVGISSTKIGKYHYMFMVGGVPVNIKNKLFYMVYAQNMEKKCTEKYSVKIPLRALLGSAKKSEIAVEKYKEQLKKKLLRYVK